MSRLDLGKVFCMDAADGDVIHDVFDLFRVRKTFAAAPGQQQQQQEASPAGTTLGCHAQGCC